MIATVRDPNKAQQLEQLAQAIRNKLTITQLDVADPEDIKVQTSLVYISAAAAMYELCQQSVQQSYTAAVLHRPGQRNCAG